MGLNRRAPGERAAARAAARKTQQIVAIWNARQAAFGWLKFCPTMGTAIYAPSNLVSIISR
jgi:hypothetical protein